jgi:hypothetical protein
LADVEEERLVRCRREGSLYDIKADTEEERALVGVWRGNELLPGLGFRGIEQLKIRIVVTGGVDYVSAPIATDK